MQPIFSDPPVLVRATSGTRTSHCARSARTQTCKPRRRTRWIRSTRSALSWACCYSSACSACGRPAGTGGRTTDIASSSSIWTRADASSNARSGRPHSRPVPAPDQRSARRCPPDRTGDLRCVVRGPALRPRRSRRPHAHLGVDRLPNATTDPRVRGRRGAAQPAPADAGTNGHASVARAGASVLNRRTDGGYARGGARAPWRPAGSISGVGTCRLHPSSSPRPPGPSPGREGSGTADCRHRGSQSRLRRDAMRTHGRGARAPIVVSPNEPVDEAVESAFAQRPTSSRRPPGRPCSGDRCAGGDRRCVVQRGRGSARCHLLRSRAGLTRRHGQRER